jgi:hypothetical protein
MFWTFKLSFDKYILAFFARQLFWLLFPKFGQFFPNLLVTLVASMVKKCFITLAPDLAQAGPSSNSGKEQTPWKKM